MAVITPTTVMGEQARDASVKKQQTAQPHIESGIKFGKIKEVAGDRKMVVLTDSATKKPMFSGQPVMLGHPVRFITDFYGTVKKGMEVLVFYQGNSGNPAFACAFIIGEENESGPNKTRLPNTASQGFGSVLMEPM